MTDEEVRKAPYGELLEEIVRLRQRIADLEAALSKGGGKTMNIALLRPIGGGRVSQWFGGNREWYEQYGLPGHNGLDYAVKAGTPVIAAHDGELCIPSPDLTGYGVHVIVRAEGYYTLYAHLSSVAREVGPVAAGEIIGYTGNTGNSTGPHLHFGLRLTRAGYQSQPYHGWVDPWVFRG